MFSIDFLAVNVHFCLRPIELDVVLIVQCPNAIQSRAKIAEITTSATVLREEWKESWSKSRMK